MCHKTLPSHLFPKQERRMDGKSNHILSSLLSSNLSLTTHTRGGRTPALWREPPTRAPLRSLIGNVTWELQSLEFSKARFASSGVSSLPGSLRSSPAASRELSLRPPLQLSSAQLISAPRSDVAGRLLGVGKTNRGRL